MSKHTKGPWTISDDHGARWIETIYGNDDVICKVAGDRKKEEAKANARLIAAAPELLAVAEKLVSASDNSDSTLAFSIACDRFIEEARSAIAKATGGQQ